MLTLIFLMVLILGSVISQTMREEVFRPSFSLGRVVTYFIAFETIERIPFKSYDTITSVAVWIFALLVFTIALVLVQKGEDYWWKHATRKT